MKKNGFTIYLRTSIKTLIDRLKIDSNNRPLLDSRDQKKTLQSIYENRKALYEEISDMTITTDPMTINSLCNKIIEKCKIEKFFS